MNIFTTHEQFLLRGSHTKAKGIKEINRYPELDLNICN
jgi:hypothetical protein